MTVVSKTCGTCSSYAEVCCDYGVCERDLRLAARTLVTGDDPCWMDAMRVLSWASNNLVDAQDDACGRWECFVWECSWAPSRPSRPRRPTRRRR